MIGMLGVLLGIGWAKAETLTCAGATLSLQSCSDGVVNIDCGAQTSCTVAARLQLTSGSCVVQRVGSCEVTVVGSSSANPAFLINTDPSKSTSLILRDIQPQCGYDSFVIVEPDENAGFSAVTLESLRATKACANDGPLLVTVNETGQPFISVSITDSVLTGWTSEGWDSGDSDSSKEGGLISLENTALTLTRSVLADNTLNTSTAATGGGFISAVGEESVLTLAENLFVLSDAATRNHRGQMFRLAAGAQAAISHNVFVDQAGVVAAYAPLIHVSMDSTLTLNHNLFYGVASTLPVSTDDGSIPSLNHNLFVGPASPWQIEVIDDTGSLVFDPYGENNWAQAGVTDDLGGPLSLGDLQLMPLAELWAELHPGDDTPTTPFVSIYDAIDPATSPIWPDSCSPLLGLDTVPGVLGPGGGGVWSTTLDITTAYDVTWYCSNNLIEKDGTTCFEENDDHCAARADGWTCKTALTPDDECLEPPGLDDTDPGRDDSGRADDTANQDTTSKWVRPAPCGEVSPSCASAPFTLLPGLLGLLAFAARRRR